MSRIDFHNVHTMLGSDTIINGSIELDEGIIIYGRVNGDVVTNGPVRIAENAIIQGNVRGSDVRVGGEVNGNIDSKGQVILGKNCILKGNIIYKKLLIEDGAKFEGKCEINS